MYSIQIKKLQNKGDDSEPLHYRVKLEEVTAHLEKYHRIHKRPIAITIKRIKRDLRIRILWYIRRVLNFYTEFQSLQSFKEVKILTICYFANKYFARRMDVSIMSLLRNNVLSKIIVYIYIPIQTIRQFLKIHRRLTQNRTMFIIAHRFSTLQNAQKIIVFKDGNIINFESHSELYARCAHYAELYDSQAGKQA